VPVKVFISSVKAGLEAERNALPGLIRAIGHEPVRFEDFSAQPTPSREACLQAVADSDVYLLLLGPRYGYVFPETGQSATHDEWVEATRLGKRRLVFKQTGVDFEPPQEEFITMVGDYGTGVFYDGFENAVDLQAKVVQAIRDLVAAPSALTFEPVGGSVAVDWRTDWGAAGAGQPEAALSVHLVPLAGGRLPARVMAAMETRVVEALRQTGAVPASAGLTPIVDERAVVVAWHSQRRRDFRDVHDGELRAFRLNSAGQVSLVWSLPGDGMGVILNEQDVADRVTRSLQLAGAMRLVEVQRYVIAAELTDLQLVSEGPVTGVRRDGATFAMNQQQQVRMEPDESVSDAALGGGAGETGGLVARALIAKFRRGP
jgi:hypothetical protein